MLIKYELNLLKDWQSTDKLTRDNHVWKLRGVLSHESFQRYFALQIETDHFYLTTVAYFFATDSLISLIVTKHKLLLFHLIFLFVALLKESEMN